MELTKEQNLHAQLVQKAWDDAEFKKELMTNPVAAIEKLTGEKLNLPEGKQIVVVDQTNDSTMYLNIPRNVSVSEGELTDEQLEAVAGGEWIVSGKGLGYDIGYNVVDWWENL